MRIRKFIKRHVRGIAFMMAAGCLLSGSASAAPILGLNSHGHDVMLLQRQLKDHGYLQDNPDGIFDTKTQKAVKKFQKDNKLKPTGMVDRATWNALKGAQKRKWGTDVKPPKKTDTSSSQIGRHQTLPQGRSVLESEPFRSRNKATDIISTAKSYIGTPYKFGGSTPKAFDCSGYLQYVFRQNGLYIPRTADEQYKLGKNTRTKKELEPGDLVFFTTYEPGASHCGIYLGKDEFIHASSSRGVRIDHLSDSYWQPRYYGGKHILK